MIEKYLKTIIKECIQEMYGLEYKDLHIDNKMKFLPPNPKGFKDKFHHFMVTQTRVKYMISYLSYYDDAGYEHKEEVSTISLEEHIKLLDEMSIIKDLSKNINVDLHFRGFYKGKEIHEYQDFANCTMKDYIIVMKDFYDFLKLNNPELFI